MTPNDEILFLLDRSRGLDPRPDPARTDRDARRVYELLHTLHIGPSVAQRATAALEHYHSRRDGAF